MTHILYHANCPDGFGAAFSAWRKFRDDAVYVPMMYGGPLPEIESGSDIYLLDFSLPPDVIEERYPDCNIFIRDHHVTAMKAWGMGGRVAHKMETNRSIYFHMEKSGAVLAWQTFHPGTEVPKLLRYVQDRDLWKFELPNSREISAGLHLYPYEFESWDGLVDHFENEDIGSAQIFREGRAALALKTNMVNQMADRSRMLTIRGHSVPAANATVFFSEVGEELCERYPEAPFAAYYFDLPDGTRKWGLRSKEFDVSEVAKSFGGGGHRNAAGFEEPMPCYFIDKREWE